MNDYILSCCSTADLTKEHFLSRGINYICFHFNMNGVTYPDDLGESISFEDFYAAVKDGADVTTSQVTMGEYVDYEEIVEERNTIAYDPDIPVEPQITDAHYEEIDEPRP